ncbi:predicted protein [Naegleria gruberi]|uniref:Predicted protein n=1 Tax=Naegleria gruberi TaxID=5762 RepID=D2VH06_NAEGR|nr:uncharacterized protein NAEGRDRAFT_49511 [Naegleria gruberi]EFC43899.1 predicted protein [Naegleria gruberi]|eukprot:XP_002676643.1 predicted protein [Naegleria gruberi strain NEG-M]
MKRQGKEEPVCCNKRIKQSERQSNVESSQNSTDHGRSNADTNLSMLNQSQDFSGCFFSFFCKSPTSLLKRKSTDANIDDRDGGVVCLLDRNCGSELLKEKNQLISEQFRWIFDNLNNHNYKVFEPYLNDFIAPKTTGLNDYMVQFVVSIFGAEELSDDEESEDESTSRIDYLTVDGLYLLALYTSTHLPKLYSRLMVFRMYSKSQILEMMKKGDTFHFENSYQEFRKDKQFVLQAMSISPSCYIYIDDSLKKDIDIALVTVKHDGYMLEKMKKQLRRNPLVVSEAISNTPLSIQYASDKIKNNIEIVTMAIKKDGMVLEFLNESFLSNVELMTYAVCSNPESFSLIKDPNIKKEVKKRVSNIKGKYFLMDRY